MSRASAIGSPMLGPVPGDDDGSDRGKGEIGVVALEHDEKRAAVLEGGPGCAGQCIDDSERLARRDAAKGIELVDRKDTNAGAGGESVEPGGDVPEAVGEGVEIRPEMVGEVEHVADGGQVRRALPSAGIDADHCAAGALDPGELVVEDLGAVVELDHTPARIDERFGFHGNEFL